MSSPQTWQAVVDAAVDDVEDKVVEYFLRVVRAVRRHAIVVEIFFFELSTELL
jgi:hypothetical protein